MAGLRLLTRERLCQAYAVSLASTVIIAFTFVLNSNFALKLARLLAAPEVSMIVSDKSHPPVGYLLG